MSPAEIFLNRPLTYYLVRQWIPTAPATRMDAAASGIRTADEKDAAAALLELLASAAGPSTAAPGAEPSIASW